MSEPISPDYVDMVRSLGDGQIEERVRVDRRRYDQLTDG